MLLEEIKEFLKDFQIQQLLAEENLDKVYELYESKIANPRGEYVSSLTEFFTDNKLNPLEYLHNLPDGLFCDNESDFPRDIILYSRFRIIPEYCFWGSFIRSVIIEEGVEYIRACAFDSCRYLQSITLPKSIKYIDQTAFIGTTDFTVNCYENSYAHEWALEQGANIFLL